MMDGFVCFSFFLFPILLDKDMKISSVWNLCFTAVTSFTLSCCTCYCYIHIAKASNDAFSHLKGMG